MELGGYTYTKKIRFKGFEMDKRKEDVCNAGGEQNIELIISEKRIEINDKKPESKSEKYSNISDVTDIIGGTGWWQRKVLVLSMINYFTTAFNHLGLSFLAYPLDHWCERPSINISLDEWWTDFVPNTTILGRNHHSQCEMFLFNNSTERQEESSLTKCESFEYSKEFYSIMTEWDLVCSREWMISASQTVYMIGFLLTALFTGHIADNIGRKRTLILCYMVQIISGISAAFSSSIIMFSICRFFVAIGQGGAGLTAYVIVVESIDSRYRVRYVCILEFGWIFGCMCLPLVAWLVPNWFYLQLAFTLPSFFMLSYIWLLPESPRWLVANGCLKRVLPILKEAIQMNKKDDADLEAKVETLIHLHMAERNKRKSISVLDLLRTPNLRLKTLCLYFIWTVTAFTYFAFTMSTNDLEGNNYVNFFLSAVMEIFSAILFISTIDRFGRKKPLYVCFLICGLAIGCCIFVPADIPVLEIVLVMIGKLCITSAFVMIFLFSSETFPTVARNIGVGSCSSMGRLGSAIAPFMRELGIATSPAVPQAIFSLFCIICSLIIMKMPETHKKSMPETLGEAESFGKKNEKESEDKECAENFI